MIRKIKSILFKQQIFALLALSSYFFISCAQNNLDSPSLSSSSISYSSSSTPICNDINLASDTKFLTQLSCPNDFEVLSQKFTRGNYGNINQLKILYNIEDSTIYFFNSNTYELHYEFAKLVLNFPHDRTQFDQLHYYTTGNRFYHLATLNYYDQLKLYTMEVGSYDPINATEIDLVYNAIIENSNLSDPIYFLARAQRHVNLLDQLSETTKLIGVDEIFGSQTYQSLNPSTAYGYLRKVSIDSIHNYSANSHDIILTNGIPNHLPVVAGIITTEFQQYLSHINVLSSNRKTPNMALKTAWEDLDSLNHKLVKLVVANNEYSISQTTLAEAEAFWAQNSYDTVSVLDVISDTTGLNPVLTLDKFDYKSTSLVGAKAANFSELKRIESKRFKLPEITFAIPIAYYFAHIKEHNIDSLINFFLAQKDSIEDLAWQKLKLQEIQETIINNPLDFNFINNVKTHIDSSEGIENYEKIRFRSSTNAEDLPGFNGAGLYSSFSGIVSASDDEAKSIANAIKKVWASYWNYNAFQERSYFNIDHLSGGMGVLAHRSFPDELANGVALTQNINNPSYMGYTINLQYGEVSVVDPPLGVISEQYIHIIELNQNQSNTNNIEYISHSNIYDYDIMKLDEKENLFLALREIEAYFYHYNIFPGAKDIYYFALDIEFKVYGESRDLYIKQVRSFD